MPLIDRTYFEGEILLAGLSDQATRSAIDMAIETYEDEYLRAVLGPSLYAAFMAGLTTGRVTIFSDQFSDQFLKASLAQRWDWIRNGHTFMHNGCSHYWPGLVNKKRSPIAQYVYWHIRANTVTSPASTGAEVAPSHENSTPATADRKMVRAWNRMVDWNRSLAVLITGGQYPELNRGEMRNPDSVDVYHHQNIFNL